MSKRITKAEQRIIDLIAERPNAVFFSFDWLSECWTVEARLSATKESCHIDNPQYVMIGDEDQTWWEGRTTLSVLARLADRGLVQSFDDVAADNSYARMKTVRPIKS